MLIAIIITIFALWVVFNTRVFTPDTGLIYVFSFLGKHLFQIHLKEGNEWYQTLSFYLLLPFFKVPNFTYHWTQTMTLERAKQKEKEINENKLEESKAHILWQQKKNGVNDTRKDSELGAILMRSETMNNLKEIETFVFSAEFETKDTFRGDRAFEINLEIQDLSKFISTTQIPQERASNLFRTAYQNWAKQQDYEDIRTITTKNLLSQLGEAQGEIVQEINEYLSEKQMGFQIDNVSMLDIYLSPESLDMLEKQELKRKAELEQEAEKVKMQTLRIQTEAEKQKIILLSEGESTKIENLGKAQAAAEREIGTAEADVLGLKTEKMQAFIKNTTPDIQAQLKSKYGVKGMGKEKGGRTRQKRQEKEKKQQKKKK